MVDICTPMKSDAKLDAKAKAKKTAEPRGSADHMFQKLWLCSDNVKKQLVNHQVTTHPT